MEEKNVRKEETYHLMISIGRRNLLLLKSSSPHRLNLIFAAPGSDFSEKKRLFGRADFLIFFRWVARWRLQLLAKTVQK